MSEQTERHWWPFKVEISTVSEFSEAGAKLEFLEEAVKIGAKSFVQNDELECGAVAESGRECLIVWRGKQRADVLLIEGGELKTKQSFVAPNECDAFRQAAAMGLAWLKNPFQ